MRDTQRDITRVCDQIKTMLLEKNVKYGDSAIRPIRFLSKTSPVEQILVRIDDKLNRIKQGQNGIQDDEDVIDDLIGYFILLKICLQKDKDAIDYEPVNWDDFVSRSDILDYSTNPLDKMTETNYHGDSSLDNNTHSL